MASVHFSLGENMGETLYFIAIEKIQKGDIKGAYDTYKRTLPGMTDELVLPLLKGEKQLVTADDGVSMNYVETPPRYVFGWKLYVFDELDNLSSLASHIRSNYFQKNLHVVDLAALSYEENSSLLNLAFSTWVDALKQGKRTFELTSTSQYFSNYDCYLDWIVHKVEIEQFAQEQTLKLYDIGTYVDTLIGFIKEAKRVLPCIDFLLRVNLVGSKDIRFFWTKIGNIYYAMLYLSTFSYSFASKLERIDICDSFDKELRKYRSEITNLRMNLDMFGSFRRGVPVPVNIMDGYDAGWLSPDGDFYGMNGNTREMLHMQLESTLSIFTEKVPDVENESNDIEWKLNRLGWFKIHHDEVYRYGGVGVPAPTSIQIKMICDYIDKYYNGVLRTKPAITALNPDDGKLQTVKLRQMDEIAAKNAFM